MVMFEFQCPSLTFQARLLSPCNVRELDVDSLICGIGFRRMWALVSLVIFRVARVQLQPGFIPAALCVLAPQCLAFVRLAERTFC